LSFTPGNFCTAPFKPSTSLYLKRISLATTFFLKKKNQAFFDEILSMHPPQEMEADFFCDP